MVASPLRLLPVVVPACVGALLLASTSGCAASRPATTAQSDLSVVVLGDSVSVADSEDFDGGQFGPGSWAAYTDGDPVDMQGGWALNGATTGYLVDHAEAVRGDVLVIMAGTNDVLQEVPWAVTRRNLITLADRSDVDRVVLCSIVPSTAARTENVAFNSRLRDLARTERWDAVDCADHVRAVDGGWLPGDSDDGIHPTAEGAETIGRTIREHLLAVGQPTNGDG